MRERIIGGSPHARAKRRSIDSSMKWKKCIKQSIRTNTFEWKKYVPWKHTSALEKKLTIGTNTVLVETVATEVSPLFCFMTHLLQKKICAHNTHAYTRLQESFTRRYAMYGKSV